MGMFKVALSVWNPDGKTMRRAVSSMVKKLPLDLVPLMVVAQDVRTGRIGVLTPDLPVARPGIIQDALRKAGLSFPTAPRNVHEKRTQPRRASRRR